MSVSIRIIPCLDVDNGRVVKGVNFENLRDAGDPVELAKRYGEMGADELTFLDVSATSSGRATMLDVVKTVADQVFIPLTVGGGVRSVDDVDQLLRAGADKVGVNSAGIARPELISEISARFGSQVLVMSIDARRVTSESPASPAGFEIESGFEVTTHGGKRGTGIDAIKWIAEVTKRGAGEILLNSMDADGVQQGFDLELIAQARAVTNLPLIASGGAGVAEHFPPAVQAGADAVLAASIFHFQTVEISQAKAALAQAGYEVRL